MLSQETGYSWHHRWKRFLSTQHVNLTCICSLYEWGLIIKVHCRCSWVLWFRVILPHTWPWFKHWYNNKNKGSSHYPLIRPVNHLAHLMLVLFIDSLHCIRKCASATLLLERFFFNKQLISFCLSLSHEYPSHWWNITLMSKAIHYNSLLPSRQSDIFRII